MNFTKKQSYLGLIIAFLLTLSFIGFQPQVRFDYDFESFFPQESEELQFYLEHRLTFENDNDYLLIAINHKEGIFRQDFLQKVVSFQDQLQNLEKVEGVQSLLTAKQPIISPFGVRMNRVLDPLDSARYLKQVESIKKSSIWEGFYTPDEQFLLLVLQNEQRIEKEAGDDLYEEIRQLIEIANFDRVETAGKIKAQGAFVTLLQEEFSFFLGVGIILIVTILFILFRSIWGVVIPLVVIALGIGWTLAWMLLMGKPLDVMTVMQPIILSVIGLAGLVHFLNYYLTYVRDGKSHEQAVQAAFSGLILAVFLTSLTTSLGFLSLYFTQIPTLSYFGLYTGLGVGWMFLSMILITPGLLYLLPPLPVKDRPQIIVFWRKSMRKFFLWVISYKKSIPLVFGAITLISIIGLSQLKVNGYILDNLPEGNALMESFLFFDQSFGGSKPLEIALTKGSSVNSLIELEVLKEIENLELFLAETYDAGAIISPLSLVKTVHQGLNNGNERAFTIPSKGQLKKVQQMMPSMLENSPIPMVTEDLQKGRLSARTADMGSLKSKQLNEELINYVDKHISPEILIVHLTGTSHLIDISHEAVSQQLAKGLFTAFLLVAFIAGVLFRSWRIGLIVLIPNLIPLLWLTGMMWIFGIDFKLTTAIVFTVAFGIAVDDSIHFMTKFYLELKKGSSMLYALKRSFLETGKAIILTTLILVAGFGVLVLSQFGVTFYAGLLIGSALIFALLADLILLPVMLLNLRKSWISLEGKAYS
ncbi:efflux RND transporter permease subunit [Mongoliitalea daihaiensis]|uniref:efflux RND transporter permease subunit n=1 Tax=Mongoliitalea daihaiensis TaxID=2782006 RepID=UPI001F1BF17A|nr:efflux RND transporter permease subunit [Mongoliitalea daihaiensis]UJP63367.1 MMPL family transporter [Mongoliitalea daihaiensis]